MEKKVIITDLDGTLYFQKPVQLFTGFELCCYYTVHFYKMRELFLILKYRKQHNQNSSIDIHKFASENNISVNKIKNLTNLWLIEKPLKWIKIFGDYGLMDILRNMQKNAKIIVYSDYPTEQKLRALNFIPNEQFFYDNKVIFFTKPNPQGINYIVQKLNIKKEKILVVGDRLDKDGSAALNCNIDFVILSANPFIRFFQKRKMIKTYQIQSK